MECISRIHRSRLPSRSSTSSPSSKPLTCRAYSSKASIVSAGSPIVFLPVYPVPSPTMTLPGAILLMDAAAAAVTGASLLLGIATSVPNLMRDVNCAASAIVAQTSE